MRRIALFFGLAALVMSSVGGDAHAIGNESKGRQLVEYHGCLSCHGDTARADQPGIPILDGQKTGFLIRTLLHFKVGRVKAGPESNEIIVQRIHPRMNALADQMRLQDIQDIATFFALRSCSTAGNPMPTAAPPEGVDRCEVCHGGVRSNPWGDTPFLSGQDRDYLTLQIQRLWDGRGDYDESSARHHRLAEIMFDDDDGPRLEAYADYYASLPCAR